MPLTRHVFTMTMAIHWPRQRPFKNPFHTINNNKITLKLQQHRTPPTRRKTKDTKAIVAGSDPLATAAAIQSNS